VFKNLLIGVAIFGLGWGASFGAGAAWGRRSTAAAAGPQVVAAGQFGAGAAGAAGAPGAPGAPGAGGAGTQGAAGGAAAARGAAGTVDRVDGQTLFVAGPNGQQTRVALTDQTQIMKQAPGTPADLTPGSRVAVVSQGQPGPDGTITAASVSLLPEGAAPGAQGQGGQGGQGGAAQRGQGGQARQGG
jgi:pilus assembly protein FimV